MEGLQESDDSSLNCQVSDFDFTAKKFVAEPMPRSVEKLPLKPAEIPCALKGYTTATVLMVALVSRRLPALSMLGVTLFVRLDHSSST